MDARALPGDWRDLTVICAANNWTGIKLADHHMAERLARLGPVLYVDPPLSHLTVRNHPELAPALEGPRLRVIGDRLARLTPVVLPRPSKPGMTAVTAALTRRAIRRAAARLGPVRALVSAWPLYPVFGCCAERLAIYWAQDDFAAGATLMGVDHDALVRGESRRAHGAGAVVAANPAVADRWRSEGLDVTLIPYGCDPETFADLERVPPAAGVDLPGPVAVLVGQLNARADLALLEAVVDRGMSLLVVGPNLHEEAERASRLLARPTVHWAGPQPYAALPGFLRHAAVGLVPYVDSAFNRGSFPLKTLEYLSAGLPVVATGLPATRWLNTDLVTIADSPADFAAAAHAAAAVAGDPPLVARRRRFAEAHSYAARAADLDALIAARIAARTG